MTSISRWVGSAVCAIVVVSLVGPQLFTDFRSVRMRLVQARTLPTTDGKVTVKIASEKSSALIPPFSLIARVHNPSDEPISVALAVDGDRLCQAVVPGHVTSRLDCTVQKRQIANVVISEDGGRAEVWYLEVGTHFGALTPGPRNLIILPIGSTAFSPASPWTVVTTGVLLWIGLLGSRVMRFRRIHFGVVVALICILAVVALTRFVSFYQIILAGDVAILLSGLVAVPVALSWARKVFRGRSAARALAKLYVSRRDRLTIGLLVGAVSCLPYCLFAWHRVSDLYGGNATGLLAISRKTFDANPIVSGRDDLRSELLFDEGGGYDAQFSYYIAFDPLLRTFRAHPEVYRGFIDSPPYRLNRVGFSALTFVASLGDSRRFASAMVALVLVGVFLSGVILARLAQGAGRSPLWGLVVIVFPGYWLSVQSTLPEPIAAALLLCGILLADRGRWGLASVALAASLLVRETGVVIVWALVAWHLQSGTRRQSLVAGALATAALGLWRVYVCWVLYPDWGLATLTFHPPDLGMPFVGILDLWTLVLHGRYFDGNPEMTRAAISYPLLLAAGLLTALVGAVRRPSPYLIAAVAYGLVGVSLNYEAIWVHVGNAQRGTFELFLTLALVTTQKEPTSRWLFSVFWVASAAYLILGAFDASAIRAVFLIG